VPSGGLVTSPPIGSGGGSSLMELHPWQAITGSKMKIHSLFASLVHFMPELPKQIRKGCTQRHFSKKVLLKDL
jgi:hypothetical protein